MRRTYNYHRRSFSHYDHRESQRSEVKQGLVGIDDDVLEIFNGLSGLKRSNLFNHYQIAHGKSAADYARDKIGEWAKETVKPSAKTLARLLALVPKILDQNQKYDLLKKLYDGHRNGHQEYHRLTVIVGYSGDFQQQVNDMAIRLCSKPSTHTLPTYVQEKIAWVCDHNSHVMREIMAAIETDHSIAIAGSGTAEVKNLVSRIQRMDISAEGTHTIKFPYGVITVCVRTPNLFEKIRKFFS